jgi:hypothetical protein
MSVLFYKFGFQARYQELFFEGIAIRAGDVLARIAYKTGHDRARGICLRMFRDNVELKDHDVLVRNTHVMIRRTPAFTKPEPLTPQNSGAADPPAPAVAKIETRGRRGVPVSVAKRFAPENQVSVPSAASVKTSVDIICGWLGDLRL